MAGGLGVLGGAFNPPHIGHLLLAQEARWRLKLDRVLLMVTGEAPHKEIEGDPGAEVRLEMATRAAAGEEVVEASALEVEREGPSYAHRTLELLAEEQPGRRLFFLVGADVAASLESWEKPERVLELAKLAVVPRQDIEMEAVDSTLERLGAADRAEIIQMPLCGVSSTMIRERVRRGQPLRHLIPEGVEELIADRELYR